MEEKQTLEDSTIVAFLSPKGFKVIPQKTFNARVVFMVEGNNINQALQDLCANAQVGVLDFIKTLKAVHSSIFAIKAGGERQ